MASPRRVGVVPRPIARIVGALAPPEPRGGTAAGRVLPLGFAGEAIASVRPRGNLSVQPRDVSLRIPPAHANHGIAGGRLVPGMAPGGVGQWLRAGHARL